MAFGGTAASKLLSGLASVPGRVARATVGAALETSFGAGDFSKMGPSALSNQSSAIADAVDNASTSMRSGIKSVLNSMNRDYETMKNNMKTNLNKQLGNIYDFNKKQWGFQQTVWFNLLKNLTTGLAKGIKGIGTFLKATLDKVGSWWGLLLNLGKKVIDFFNTNVLEFTKKKITELKSLLMSMPGAPQALENLVKIRNTVFELGRSMGQAPTGIREMTSRLLAMGNALVPAEKYLEAYQTALQAGARGSLADEMVRTLGNFSQATNTSMDTLTTFYLNLRRMGKSDAEINRRLNEIYGAQVLSEGRTAYGINTEAYFQALNEAQATLNTFLVSNPDQSAALARTIDATAWLQAESGITHLVSDMQQSFEPGTNLFGMLNGRAAQLAVQGPLEYWNAVTDKFGGFYAFIGDSSVQAVNIAVAEFAAQGMTYSPEEIRRLKTSLFDLAVREGYVDEAGRQVAQGHDFLTESLERSQTPATLLDNAIQELGNSLNIGNDSAGGLLEEFGRFETVFEQVNGGMNFLGGSLQFLLGPVSALVEPFTAISTIFMGLGALYKEDGDFFVSDEMLDTLGPLGASLKLLRTQGSDFGGMFQNLWTMFKDFFNNLFVEEVNDQGDSLFEVLIHSGIDWLSNPERQDTIQSMVTSFSESVVGGLTNMFESMQKGGRLWEMVSSLFNAVIGVLTTFLVPTTTLLAQALTTLIETIVASLRDAKELGGAVMELIEEVSVVLAPLISSMRETMILALASIFDSMGGIFTMWGDSVAYNLRSSIEGSEAWTDKNFVAPAQRASEENLGSTSPAVHAPGPGHESVPLFEAEGGVNALVGEAGPEIVMPLEMWMAFGVELAAMSVGNLISAAFSGEDYGKSSRPMLTQAMVDILQDIKKSSSEILESMQKSTGGFSIGSLIASFIQNPMSFIGSLLAGGLNQILNPSADGPGLLSLFGDAFVTATTMGMNYSIDQVLDSVATAESGNNPRANNGIAAGAFQFTPGTWESVTGNRLSLDEIASQSLATQRSVAQEHILNLLERYASTETPLELALGAYNGGYGFVNGWNNFYDRANYLRESGGNRAWEPGGYGKETVTYVLRNRWMIENQTSERPSDTELYQTYLGWDAIPVPAAAKGGTVLKETLLIAGEAGPEEIAPYSKINENTKLSIASQRKALERLKHTLVPVFEEAAALLSEINDSLGDTGFSQDRVTNR